MTCLVQHTHQQGFRLWSRVFFRLALAVFAVTGLAVVSAAESQSLENEFLRVDFDSESPGVVCTLTYKPTGARFASVALGETVVFANGTERALPTLVTVAAKDNAKQVAAFTAPLPPNPLRGRRPGSTCDLPFFDPSDTALVQLTKTFVLQPDSAVLAIRYHLRNGGTDPVRVTLKLVRGFSKAVKSLATIPTVEGVTSSMIFPYEYDTPETWLAFNLPGHVALASFDWSTTSCLCLPAQKRQAGAVTTTLVLKANEQQTLVSQISLMPSTKGVSGAINGRVGRIKVERSAAPSKVGGTEAASASTGTDVADLFDGLGESKDETLGSLMQEIGMPGAADQDVVERLLPRPPSLGQERPRAGKKMTVRLQLASPAAWTTVLHVEAEHLISGRTITLSTQNVSLHAPGELSWDAAFTPDKAGTWIIRIREDRNTGTGEVIEETVDIGRPAGLYLRGDSPTREKRGDTFSRFRFEHFRKPGAFDQHSSAFPMSTEIAAPYTVYANPISGGPLKVLTCIAFANSHKAVDLMLRLDLEQDTVLIGAHNYVSTNPKDKKIPLCAPPDEVRAMKLALARDKEVMLFAGVLWTWFPLEVQREILRQVAEDGIPLVLSGYMGLPQTFYDTYGHGTRGNKTLPGAVSFGKGRIIFVDAGSPAAIHRAVGSHSFMGTETALENMAHILVHEARGKPAITLTGSVSKPYSKQTTTELTNRSDRAFTGTLKIIVRRESDLQEYVYWVTAWPFYEEIGVVSKAVSLPPGARSNIEFELPRVWNGAYRLFTVLEDAKGGVVDWIGSDFTFKSPVQIQNLHVTGSTRATPPRLFRDQGLTVRFDAVPTGALPAGSLTAAVRAYDISGREILRQEKPLANLTGQTPIEFVLNPQRALHRQMVVYAGIVHNGEWLARTQQKVAVDRTDRFETFRYRQLDNEYWFPFINGIVDDYFMRYAFEQFDMRGLVFGGYFADPRAPSEKTIENQLRTQALVKLKQEALAQQTTMFEMDGDDDDFGLEDLMNEELTSKETVPSPAVKPQGPRYVRNVCFNNPDFREIQRKRALQHAADPRWPLRVLACDEWEYGNRNICQCRYCMAAFAVYLQHTYGSLETLNTQWGTHFSAWNEATPHWIDKTYPVPTDKMWPRVLDTLMYKAQQHADFIAFLQKAGRTVDPKFDIGYSGMSKMTLFNGLDFYAMAKAGNFFGVYRDMTEWIGLAGPTAVFGWQSGYGKMYNPSVEQAHPWNLLARGHHGVGNYTCADYPMAGPDGRLHDGPQAFFDSFEAVQRGPAALLQSHLVNDPVAIYFSSPSFFVYGLEWWRETKARNLFDKAQGFSAADWPRRASHAYEGLCQRVAQLSPYYLGYGEVARGVWGPIRKPRVILLPYTTAMSPEEATTLRQFVEEGGVLVGSVNTATRSAHGRPWSKPLLDDVFGINRTTPYRFVVMRNSKDDTRTRAVLRLPDMDKTISFLPAVVGPPNVVADGAQAYGRWGDDTLGGPLMLVNRHGKGMAVTLNFLSVDWNQMIDIRQDKSVNSALAAALRWTLAQADVTPFSTVTTDGALEGMNVGRFQDGSLHYVAVTAPSGLPPQEYERAETRIKLAAARHVYDLRAGHYLGEIDRFTVSFAGRYVPFYACLPYRVETLSIDIPDSVTQGDVLRGRAAIQVKGDPAERHMFRVEAVRPDGRTEQILGYNQEAPHGQAEIEIPLAYNAPPGAWRITVYDVATGVRAERRVEVTIGRHDPR